MTELQENIQQQLKRAYRGVDAFIDLFRIWTQRIVDDNLNIVVLVPPYIIEGASSSINLLRFL
jgi:hypothetical protein